MEKDSAIMREWLGLFALFIDRLRIHWFANRNPNAKCPACGNKEGEIRWMPDFTFGNETGPATGDVIHRCKICTAMWGDRPLIAKQHWHVQVDPNAFIEGIRYTS